MFGLWYWPLLCSFLLLQQTSTDALQTIRRPLRSSHNHLNNRPIIGILSQEIPRSMKSIPDDFVSYIAASYVKWVEGQGARVVPIKINQDESYYAKIFHSINGLLFPGGSASFRTSGYSKAGAILFDLAVEANKRGNFFPIWGTCLGYELLLYLAANKHNYLTRCSDYDRARSLKFLPDASTSKLFEEAPESVMKTLSLENSTSNFHVFCMTRENLTVSNLDKFFKPLATSFDNDGLEYIAAIEAINYPIWGTQFHPEKNIYEWGTDYMSVPHSPSAVKAGLYFGDFFVNQARKNQHRFNSLKEEESYLIYNYAPVYTGNVSRTTNSFLQSYLFH